ncbi:rcc01693 family protein [Jiella pelagia]|uniref:Phage tail assembly chaperone n=1 Tax=Jiella pelagia TaxID=2986949 RepID=A0ABY7C5J3_9HYPH|nr:rcc01693 family protein [Jiella pelagia]WAP71283.1 phage tail assembly chaperone [Jiella pelagia]
MGSGRPKADEPAAFPWDEAMAVGFGVLRLSPEAFWKMTPRELSGVLSPRRQAGAAAPSATGLFGLMRRFPDIDRQSP